VEPGVAVEGVVIERTNDTVTASPVRVPPVRVPPNTNTELSVPAYPPGRAYVASTVTAPVDVIVGLLIEVTVQSPTTLGNCPAPIVTDVAIPIVASLIRERVNEAVVEPAPIIMGVCVVAPCVTPPTRKYG